MCLESNTTKKNAGSLQPEPAMNLQCQTVRSCMK